MVAQNTGDMAKLTLDDNANFSKIKFDPGFIPPPLDIKKRLEHCPLVSSPRRRLPSLSRCRLLSLSRCQLPSLSRCQLPSVPLSIAFFVVIAFFAPLSIGFVVIAFFASLSIAVFVVSCLLRCRLPYWPNREICYCPPLCCCRCCECC